jgi:hypothetical protein
LVTSETIDQFIGRVLKLLQALEIRADRPQPQTIEGMEYHVLKALPEKAYQYFSQKVRSATDKPKDEQEARSAFFLLHSEILYCPTSYHTQYVHMGYLQAAGSGLTDKTSALRSSLYGGKFASHIDEATTFTA